ncbi:MAG: lysophospholipid acyltransferase family protein [Pseudomonadota bacterium]
MMMFLRSLLFDLWLYGSMVVMGLIFAPFAIASRAGASWSMKLYCRQALWMLEKICGVAVEIRGAPPEGAALIAAKHQSFLDILIMMKIAPEPRFVMKRSLIYAPVLGLYALRLGVAPVDRAKGAQAIKDLSRRLSDPKDPNRQIIIYPQGTRLPPGAVAPYRRGVALLYAREPGGCVPVATNSGLFWGRRSILKRPGVAVMSFLDPIPPGLKRTEFMERLEREIETASDALLREAERRAETPTS